MINDTHSQRCLIPSILMIDTLWHCEGSPETSPLCLANGNRHQIHQWQFYLREMMWLKIGEDSTQLYIAPFSPHEVSVQSIPPNHGHKLQDLIQVNDKGILVCMFQNYWGDMTQNSTFHPALHLNICLNHLSVKSGLRRNLDNLNYRSFKTLLDTSP